MRDRMKNDGQQVIIPDCKECIHSIDEGIEGCKLDKQTMKIKVGMKKCEFKEYKYGLNKRSYSITWYKLYILITVSLKLPHMALYGFFLCPKHGIKRFKLPDYFKILYEIKYFFYV